ncbi:MAG: IS30 family transposase [Psychromonas sp.]|nr:IS30 family transposase [Psychromonas sp.]
MKDASYRGFIKDPVGIEERPEEVNNRSRVGDWEIDLVIQKGHRGDLLTIIERVTRYTVTKRIFDKLPTTVTDATIKLLALFKDFFLMISADNGKEFPQHKEVSKALECGCFFYRSIRLLALRIEQKNQWTLLIILSQFKSSCDDSVKLNLIQLNNRPRKMLLFITPF